MSIHEFLQRMEADPFDPEIIKLFDRDAANGNRTTITITISPRHFASAQVVRELPEVGRPFHLGRIFAAEVRSLEPFPYPCSQDEPENYRYSVWRVYYRPDNLTEVTSAFIAIHEPEPERM